MIIFGKAERDKVEEIRRELDEKIMAVYDQAKAYHDGKWVMFPITEESIGDYMRLLAMKRKRIELHRFFSRDAFQLLSEL